MSASFLILAIVLGGIGLLLFLILAIVALANGNKRNIIVFSSLFVVCVITVIVCVSEMFSKVGNKIKDEMQTAIVEETKRQEEEQQEQEGQRQAYLEWLKDLTPEEYKDSLSGFYDSFDMEKNVNCIPMVYPYRLEMNDSEDMHAWLATVNGKKIHELDGLVAITKFAFDSKMLLAKRDITDYTGQMPAGLPEVSYILFDFRTGKSQVFLNQQKLMDEAAKAGYTGSMGLEDLATQYGKL